MERQPLERSPLERQPADRVDADVPETGVPDVGASGTGGGLGDLVAAAKEGDRAAFEGLVRATTAETFALAYRLTGNEDDARDVVQDAYFRAYRGLRRFRGDAQFNTWLYRITANCAASHLAKRGRQSTELLNDDDEVVDARPDHDPETRLGAAEERARVAAAVADLPWRLRQVIVLRDIYDLPHRSIAEELDISEAAAKVRLHRARRRLREILDAGGQPEASEGKIDTSRGRSESKGREADAG
ncbi:MAG: sigma-70 family RNA polymerase sigma factor [Acidimicrobiaceae bacterium]|nr:sigma-70 family RNA polymerase sigma factor [Acidimicrobiaceae bacterium]